MATILYGLTDTGFVLKDYDTIYSEVAAALQLKYQAAGIVLDVNDEPLKQLIALSAEREYELWLLAQTLAEVVDPDSASGQMLSKLVAMNGLRRMAATYSTCPVLCTASGSGGFTVNPGDLVANLNSGVLWQSTETKVVAAGTSELVDFQCTEPGALSAAAGELADIMSPKANWSAAVNLVDADTGQDEETDAALRLRRRNSALTKRIAVRLAEEVDGVTEAVVYQNDTGSTDTEGRPFPSVEAVVVGGTDLDVAVKIWESKAAGMQTWGNTSQIITTEETGQNKTVLFSRVSNKTFWVRARLTVGSQFNTGVAQERRVTVENDADGNYTLTINDQDFTYAAVGKTKAQIASDLNALIDAMIAAGTPWVPVMCIYAAGNEYVTIRANRRGVPFTLSTTSNLSIQQTVECSGDQQEVIRRLADFSDATHTIGEDVYLKRLLSAIFQIPEGGRALQIYSVDLYANWATAGFVGPAVGTSDLSVGYAEKAVLDTAYITVDIV